MMRLPYTKDLNPRYAYALAVLVVVIGAALLWQTVVLSRSQTLSQEKLFVTEELNVFRAALEGNIASNANLINGLIAAIATEPDIDQARFAKLARHLLGGNHQILNIGGAPNLVIRLMYPLEGNEKAIGLDYTRNPQQREAAMRAVDEENMVLAGPLKLLQGGMGIVARVPVFIAQEGPEKGALWGLISTVLDVEALYRESGLETVEKNLEIAIRGKDGAGPEGDFFYGDSTILQQNPIRSIVSLPSGKWELLALPKQGWSKYAQNEFRIIAASLIATLLVFIPLFFIGRLLKGRQGILRELEFQKNTLDQHAIVSIADVYGDIIYANDKFCEISGYGREELIGENHRLLRSGEHSKEFYRKLWQTISSGKAWHGDIKNKTKNGSYYWVNATIVPFLNERGKPFKYVAIRTDITAQKEIEAFLAEAQRVNQTGNWSYDIEADKLIWSDEIFKIFGLDKDKADVSLKQFFELIHPDDLEAVQAAYASSVEHAAPYDIEHRAIRQDNGEVIWVHEKCIHTRDETGAVVKSSGTVQEITGRKLLQSKLEKLALTDQLTGLANRAQFDSKFADYINLAKREGNKLALLLLDLDKFKPVNDTYGHPAGDALLQRVAEIFKENCRKTDIVARIGGDEFAILLVHPLSPDDVDRIAGRIVSDIRKPMNILDHQVQIGVSIGISIFPENGDSMETLVKKADTALYKAKGLGRNTHCFYEEDA